MPQYLLKRILISIPTLLAISLVIFLILALAPGDPLAEISNNPSISEAVRENIRRSYGLDQPIHIRYVKWVWALLHGDLGYSFNSRSPVIGLIWQRLPTTLSVVGLAYGISILLAFPLGIISAIRRHTLLDQSLTTVAFIGISLPPFFTGLLFIIIFSVQLGWFPFIYDSTLRVTDWASFINQIKQSIMPIAVLVLFQTAVLMRFIRSSMTEQLSQNYVRTAYAKGVPGIWVTIRHVLRNALIPVVTLIALDVPTVFTGALITEQIFRIPGMGALLVDSIFRNDTPVVLAITIVYALLVVVFNLVADMLYAVLDPRVQLR
ncbi:MAG: ABC transporter permease [Leptolyngbyaceae bacterium]|nr:ABC transporter permease [Leptolyngbyaceae bacterium]